jgi:hypothetical protein
MSKLARALMLGAVLAVLSQGTTAVAQERTSTDKAVQLFRQGERDSQEQTSGDEAVQLFRQGERDFQEQSAAEAAQRDLRQQRHWYYQQALARQERELARQEREQQALAQERYWYYRSLRPPVQPAEPGGQPDWPVVPLGLLAVTLGLAGALAVLTARRRKPRLS